jgi:C_GCAxxG_C_C family probable redox protein
MNNVDSAVKVFGEGLSCSQAVLGAFYEQFGTDKNSAYKISSGFGGGMHCNQTCGAVTGAFMVIGLKYGRTQADDIEAKMKTAQLINEFAKKFIVLHGYINCTELLGCNISTKEGLENTRKKDLFRQVCPKYVATAAEILNRILG